MCQRADARRFLREAVARPSSILVASTPTGGSPSEGLGRILVTVHDMTEVTRR